MIQKIKTLVLAAVLPFAVAMPLAVATPAIASAACKNNISSSISEGINATSDGTSSGSNCNSPGAQNDLNALATKVVNILSVIVGIIAVIMIIFGGFRYITSGGDSSNVSSAKNTLIYAIVGLVIVALAQFIVHFVLASVNGN